jgi:hypothetical protein
MAHNASELLGSPQLAGVTVESVGYARATALAPGPTNASPLERGIAAKIVDPKGDRAQTPRFGAGFLTVTSTELALIGLRSGAWAVNLSGVIARVPRSDVASAELHGGGSVGLLTIRFHNGDTWYVEVLKVHQRPAPKVVAALSAHSAAI